MSGTVTAVEKEGYYPSKKPRVIPKVVVPVEHPKYRKAGPKGKCLKCGEKMEVKHRTPMKSGKVHLTYVCSKCKRPRVGVE
jgi:hypothetical protein